MFGTASSATTSLVTALLPESLAAGGDGHRSGSPPRVPHRGRRGLSSGS